MSEISVYFLRGPVGGLREMFGEKKSNEKDSVQPNKSKNSTFFQHFPDTFNM